MRNDGFYFEIKNLLIQFLAAFDNCVIKRFNENREAQEQIEVRYVLAPKQRVLYDIVNETHGITLPVVAVDITSISRDSDRVFNKVDGFYLPTNTNQQGKLTSKIPTPIPVNITVAMSIITKYQLDMDQIISNFVPYNNPYIILSWKIPNEAGLSYDTEIRSEVTWDGTVSFTPPIQLSQSDKYRVAADTTFTIKGWLFKKLGETSNNIFIIDNNFYNLSRSNQLQYDTLSGFNFNFPTSGVGYSTSETVVVSGIPIITNIFVANSGVRAEITDSTTLSRTNSGYSILLYGTNFNWVDNVLLSSNNTSMLQSLTSLSFAKMPTASGFILNTSQYDILSKNIMFIDIPATKQTGKFTLLLTNKVGYASTYQVKNIVFTLS